MSTATTAHQRVHVNTPLLVAVSRHIIGLQLCMMEPLPPLTSITLCGMTFGGETSPDSGGKVEEAPADAQQAAVAAEVERTLTTLLHGHLFAEDPEAIAAIAKAEADWGVLLPIELTLLARTSALKPAVWNAAPCNVMYVHPVSNPAASWAFPEPGWFLCDVVPEGEDYCIKVINENQGMWYLYYAWRKADAATPDARPLRGRVYKCRDYAVGPGEVDPAERAAAFRASFLSPALDNTVEGTNDSTEATGLGGPESESITSCHGVGSDVRVDSGALTAEPAVSVVPLVAAEGMSIADAVELDDADVQVWGEGEDGTADDDDNDVLLLVAADSAFELATAAGTTSGTSAESAPSRPDPFTFTLVSRCLTDFFTSLHAAGDRWHRDNRRERTVWWM